MRYNLSQLAIMTGLTDRTLRTHLKTGVLRGEKTDGVWSFSEEDIDAFMNDPGVRQALSGKQNAAVLDFLADRYKKENRSCVILDLPIPMDEARKIAEFFCEAINEGHDVQFRFDYSRNLARFILSGAEDQVRAIMKKYYEL